MDVNDLRIAVTVVSLLIFVGLMVWVYRRSNKPGFEAAALIPFADPADRASS